MSKHIRALLAVILLLPLLAACTPAPTPEVITKEVEKVVTKEVEKVVEKVVTQEVEKVVTKEVEKVVTATPAAAAEAPAATFERERDPLHQRHAVGSSLELEPLHAGQLRHGDAWALLRNAVPV